jgi:hypothetical protein
MTNLIMSRRGFLAGLGSLLAAPAVVRAESLMPIVPWRPTFWRLYGAGRTALACRANDLIGVDLASLGLPQSTWPSSSWVRLWGYSGHPLGSLPRDKVRVPDYQRQMRDIEAAHIAAGLPAHLTAEEWRALR